jgi:signal transduction histidine kinase
MARSRQRVAVADLLRELLGRREDQVPVHLELTAQPWVHARPTSLALAVENLIDNAVRVSPPGGRVAVRLGAEDGRAVIEVVDQGAGLPPGAHDQVFEPFAWGDGLGLAASHAIANAYGGRLELKAPPNTFRLTLPAS